ncbi:Wzz/FepE/Etk N-terminal domain-containing protein [Ulvibacterium sp.]|uniref:Wzz/FepE/Etk N-terminal domain-containing protein n=1 Tax=Ulvibacterium sp. TaxID=2665914 RepID=UPI003CC5BF88
MSSKPSNHSQEGPDYREILKPYLKSWKWFVISGITALIIGFIYIRYAVPHYAVEAKIQILDNKQGSSQLSVFEDLGMLGEGGIEIEDEIEIIKSRSNLIALVKELGLNINITALGNIKNSPIYRNPDPPFNINFIAPDSLVHNSRAGFFITLSSKTTFEYAENDKGPTTLYSYGKTISSPVGEIIVTPNNVDSHKFGTNYVVSVNPLSTVAANYQKALEISVENHRSKILTLSLNDAIVPRAQDVINTLIAIYNQNAIDDKKALADRTSEFIDDRISQISSSLTSADESAVEFKSDRGLTDIAT